MAKKEETAGFWANMSEPALYKRNQGRMTRQLSAVGAALLVFLGVWTLSNGPLGGSGNVWIRVGIPVAIGAAGAWAIYRAVNYPKFADFLISVEAEMDKVTWATREDLQRSTMVVIVVMFFLGIVLFTYDLIWSWFFQLIGFLQIGPGGGPTG
jgi:preprotein translocase subunit SecE